LTIKRLRVWPDYARFMIRNSSKIAIFCSYKIVSIRGDSRSLISLKKLNIKQRVQIRRIFALFANLNIKHYLL